MRVLCGSAEDSVHGYQRIRRPFPADDGSFSARLAAARKPCIKLGAKACPEPAKGHGREEDARVCKSLGSASARLAREPRCFSERFDARRKVPSNPNLSREMEIGGSRRHPSADGCAEIKGTTRRRRLGLVDILLGYHTLLQAATNPSSCISSSSSSSYTKNLYPTIGFVRNSS